jgi:hypothetical protein
MANATNKGTCQWCNRVQLLPNGVLSRHGYNIRFGWQAGTCGGSKHPPYQESCALIERSIEWARRRSAELRNEAANVLNSGYDGSAKAWVHVYKRELSSRTRGSVYFWEEHEVLADARFGGYYIVGGKKETIARSFARIKPENARYYSDEINRRADSLDGYADEQAKRIKDWAPAPLLPLK